ncbi:MAG TPA: ATP-binding cassette domain-containing protein [Methylomirabilota bacterium]|jgi:branched-chain amino acid transport system ATP-binding protein|nr:ATP-binding cassette domain-containing protein [Methylomirabilota bacterium]
MAALLALRGVSKTFGSLRVIDDLSLSIASGEALGLIGPNGAGKTTALNLLIGRLRPEQGAVVLDGRDVTAVAPHARCRAGIALTHQIPHPFEALTVFENVLVGGIFGAGRAERLAHAPALAALRLTGLVARANDRAGVLTLLERKRLELARALATAPRVLLLDEIAGGLGEGEVHELVEVIRRVHREGVAIVWIEHIVHALRSVVSRLAVISAGRLLTEGPPDDVMGRPDVQRVYLGIDVQ